MNWTNMTQNQCKACCFENFLEQQHVNDYPIVPIVLNSVSIAICLAACIALKNNKSVSTKENIPLLENVTLDAKKDYSRIKKIFSYLFPSSLIALNAANLKFAIQDSTTPRWLWNGFYNCANTSCSDESNNQKMNVNNLACKLTNSQAFCSYFWEEVTIKTNVLLGKSNMPADTIYAAANASIIFCSLYILSSHLYYRNKPFVNIDNRKISTQILTGTFLTLSIIQLAFSLLGAVSNRGVGSDWKGNINYCL